MEFVLLRFLALNGVVLGLFVDSSQIVQVGFQSNDLLSVVGKNVLRVLDGFVLISDFESKTVTFSVQILVLSVGLFSFDFEFLNKSLVLISSFALFSNSVLDVVIFVGMVSVLVSESVKL